VTFWVWPPRRTATIRSTSGKISFGYEHVLLGHPPAVAQKTENAGGGVYVTTSITKSQQVFCPSVNFLRVYAAPYLSPLNTTLAPSLPDGSHFSLLHDTRQAGGGCVPVERGVRGSRYVYDRKDARQSRTRNVLQVISTRSIEMILIFFLSPSPPLRFEHRGDCAPGTLYTQRAAKFEFGLPSSPASR